MLVLCVPETETVPLMDDVEQTENVVLTVIDGDPLDVGLVDIDKEPDPDMVLVPEADTVTLCESVWETL